ncbi:hypothetical protein EC900039_1542, partial [Escherichia coli 90.0039]|jgi:hypothetical protein
MQPQ